jgi:stalled ribosome rescue protein Dom34
MPTKTRYKRGYPMAILIGLEENCAAVWKVFSEVIKPEKTLHLEGTRNNANALYNYHESIINALRPMLKEGVRSIILASLARTSYSQEFLDHVHAHHPWLTQGLSKAVFSNITGAASTLSQVAALARTLSFHQLISQTASEETENLIDLLERRLSISSSNTVFFSLEEAENLILNNHRASKAKPEFLLLTDKYLADSRQRNRLHRLMQIAANKKVNTRIVNSESSAGKRITQLGGIVCLTENQ